MAVLTGADGQMLHGANVLGKVSQFTLSSSRDALESTCLGDFDRTYVEGLRGTTGSATLYYDPANTNANNFLNTYWTSPGEPGNTGAQEVTFKMNRFDYPQGGGVFECSGFLTSVSPSVSVGDVQAVSVQFQISGKPSGGF